MRKVTNFLLVVLFLAAPCSAAFCQPGIWNSNSLSFTKDNASLEDMTAATAVSFNTGPLYSSGAITFGTFSLRYGLNSYNNFYISPYGFIKLGAAINSNNATVENNVIAALYNGTFWNAVSYKLSGAGSGRKMVIQYQGVMQPSGEPTSFQIWLFERTGKIQFVYEALRGYYGYPSAYSYRVFCNGNIMGNNVTASVKINPNNTTAAVGYNGISFNVDSIYPLTRFTFQPDTVKPVIPSQLNFSNVQAGCLTVNFSDNSGNESVIALERADSVTNYHAEKFYYTNTPAGSTPYSNAQSALQPFWTYHYRTYCSNGFINSDTLYNSVQTLMPQINGIKSVPGDYPSITALLQDAACKHLGPDIIIELQNNYSFAAETLPLVFPATMQTRLIHSVVIRPAANATINWTASTSGPMFYVDSVKHVFLDGRPGGTGTAQGLTIFQQNPVSPAVQFSNNADSCGVNYCRIIKKNGSNLSYALAVLPLDNTFGYNKKDINAFSLTNNYFSADSATVSDLVFVKPADSTKAANFIISGNQFSRFRRTAINVQGGGEGLLISNNHFFQPIPFVPEVYLPATNASCITLSNTGTTTIDNNFFGGSSNNWGTGKFSITGFGFNYSFINYENNAITKKAFITNNKFGNIEVVGYAAPVVKLIYASKGNVVVDNNRFGTADSVNSITSSAFFWGLDLWYGSKIISNNFFSGFQGGYLTGGNVNNSTMVNTSFADSVALLNNDIGGSNNINANASSGAITAVTLSAERSTVIRNNNFRGMKSLNSVLAITGAANSYQSGTTTGLIIDNNSIHHIQAAAAVNGITVNVNSTFPNQISNNNIYALQTTGTANGPYGPEGAIFGIYYQNYNAGLAPRDYKGEVHIFGNRIHSFDAIRVVPGSVYRLIGIVATCPVTKIYNNELRLGINSRGQSVDSLASTIGVIIEPADYQEFFSDKHFIEHNSIYFGGRGMSGSAISLAYSTNYVSDRNVVTITNNILQVDRYTQGSSLGEGNFQSISAIRAVSANNIWYSAGQSTTGILKAYKQSCNCDSSSFMGDPAFVNPAGDSSNFDLHTGVLSKAESAGTPSVLNIQTDLENRNRAAYSPVDIGAYAAVPCGSGNLPLISITPGPDTVQLCPGVNTQLAATVSGGAISSLQWQKDLIDISGATSPALSVTTPGAYRLVGLTACGKVASRIINITGSSLQSTVSIQSTADSICLGAEIVFFATAVNAGASPLYQWQVNGVNQGTNSPQFRTVDIHNSDIVKVLMTPNICTTGLPVESNLKKIIVRNPETPAVAVAANATAICAGTPVTFTATATNGGDIPVYQWFVNNALTGSGTTSFTSSNLANNDKVSCQLTSNATCVTTSAATSNTVTISVSPAGIAAVTIKAAATSVCAGDQVSFTAALTSAQKNAAYQWKVNDIATGANNAQFSTTLLKDKDRVKLTVTGNELCTAGTFTISSNIIDMAVTDVALPQFTASGGLLSVTSPDAGISYTWQNLNGNQWNDVAVSTTSYTATISGEYRVKAERGGCTALSASQSVTVVSQAPDSAGRLYPNPTERFITLEKIISTQQWVSLQVKNFRGQVMASLHNIGNQTRIKIDAGGFSAGLYFITVITTDGKVLTFKFVKT